LDKYYVGKCEVSYQYKFKSISVIAMKDDDVCMYVVQAWAPEGGGAGGGGRHLFPHEYLETFEK
jgi:hypothetical protein